MLEKVENWKLETGTDTAQRWIQFPRGIWPMYAYILLLTWQIDVEYTPEKTKAVWGLKWVPINDALGRATVTLG